MACGVRRILQFSVAIPYQAVRLKDVEGTDISKTCMYSWSTDMVCWTDWTNYVNYNKICKNIESDYYLRVLLFGSVGDVYLNGKLTTCYNICLDTSNPFLEDFCGNANLFQPYNNLDCALLLQQQLADSIICMFGIPVYYFRVEPKMETADFTFKEFSLHNVVDIKQIKLMIPDGTMPSSNPKLSDFDFDWETDWEVELSKSQFASAFGDKTFPKQRDFIYIPMMKRMWAVNAAYDEKNEGLLWRPTTWKLALVKYDESTNVDIPENMDSLIDNWVINTYENTFEEYENNEQKRLTGSTPLGSPTHASNSSSLYGSSSNLESVLKYDSLRNKVSRNIKIIDKQLYHRNSIISRNMYTFGDVLYQEGMCGNDGTLMFILQTPSNPIENDLNIIEFGAAKVKIGSNSKGGRYLLKFAGLEGELDTDSIYMVVLKWNKKNIVTEMNVYPYTYNQDVPKYMLRPDMYWFDYEHPAISTQGRYYEDLQVKDPQACSISTGSGTVGLSNIKYYNTYLDQIDSIKEATKYTTQHENCIINDLARPLTSGLGYQVR